VSTRPDVPPAFDELDFVVNAPMTIVSMSPVRFATALSLFETFPELSLKISARPSEQFPVEFLQTLVTTGKVEDAVTFCSYLLPRREAVWWACGCVRTLLRNIAEERAAALLAAEAWVKEPDDERRQAALELGTSGNCDDPLTWVALAAGWAGGFLVSGPQRSIPMPQYMTARATRTAILIGALSVTRDQRPAYLQACVADGTRLAENGP
jgi:hypothetical protein